MEIRKYYLFLLLFFSSYMALAQNDSTFIYGRIVDSDSILLPGVTILEKGTANVTVSDIFGNFNLKVKQGATLVFSFLGFKNIEFLVGNNNELNILLPKASSELEEVVVVGY